MEDWLVREGRENRGQQNIPRNQDGFQWLNELICKETTNAGRGRGHREIKAEG